MHNQEADPSWTDAYVQVLTKYQEGSILIIEIL